MSLNHSHVLRLTQDRNHSHNLIQSLILTLNLKRSHTHDRILPRI